MFVLFFKFLKLRIHFLPLLVVIWNEPILGCFEIKFYKFILYVYKNKNKAMIGSSYSVCCKKCVKDEPLAVQWARKHNNEKLIRACYSCLDLARQQANNAASEWVFCCGIAQRKENLPLSQLPNELVLIIYEYMKIPLIYRPFKQR